MVGPSVSPLGPMLRAEAIVGRRLLVAAWRRELGALCSAVAEIGGQTGDNNIDVQNAHSQTVWTERACGGTVTAAINVGF